MRNRFTSILLAFLLALGGAVALATPAQAAGSMASYSCQPPYGTGGVSVKVGYSYFALYPCQTRDYVTTYRIWAKSCMVWRYFGGSQNRTTCNYGTGNFYMTNLGSTLILGVYRV